MALFFGKKGIDYNKVSKELELYKGQRELEYDKKLFEKEQSTWSDLQIKRRETSENLSKLSEEFHKSKSDKVSSLARLDAEIDFKRGTLAKIVEFDKIRAERDEFKAKSEAATSVIKAKDDTITLLNELVKVVTGKLPKVELDKLNLNVSVPSSTVTK